jgi:hypothetical protein
MPQPIWIRVHDVYDQVSADDVTRMNATMVSRLLYPRTVRDVQHAVYRARAEGRHVTVRGGGMVMMMMMMRRRRRRRRRRSKRG